MTKKTFLVICCGFQHVVRDADQYIVQGSEATFTYDGVRVAYFSGVSAVIEQGQQPDPAFPLGQPFSGLGSVADFAIRPTVEIGTLNITCPAGKQEFAAEMIKAIASVNLVPGVV
jgi:hypothetical protein